MYCRSAGVPPTPLPGPTEIGPPGPAASPSRRPAADLLRAPLHGGGDLLVDIAGRSATCCSAPLHRRGDLIVAFLPPFVCSPCPSACRCGFLASGCGRICRRAASQPAAGFGGRQVARAWAARPALASTLGGSGALATGLGLGRLDGSRRRFGRFDRLGLRRLRRDRWRRLRWLGRVVSQRLGGSAWLRRFDRLRRAPPLSPPAAVRAARRLQAQRSAGSATGAGGAGLRLGRRAAPARPPASFDLPPPGTRFVPPRTSGATRSTVYD